MIPSTVPKVHGLPRAALPALNWTVPVAFVVVVAVNVTDDPSTEGLALEEIVVAVDVNTMVCSAATDEALGA